MSANYRDEHTGNAALDRIQGSIRRLVEIVRDIDNRLPALYVLALQQAFTTTSNLAQATPLAFPVRRGELWHVRFWGLAGCSGSADGMKYAVIAPAGSEISGALDTSLTTSTDDAHVQISAVNTLTSAVHTTNGGTRDDEMAFRLKAAADGTCAIAVASTTSGNTTTLAAKALIEAKRYREVR